MRKYNLNEAANDLDAQPGVIELQTWTDSISVRYSGGYSQLNTLIHEHNLFIQNLDGVVYFSPRPGYSLDNTCDNTPCSASEFEEIDCVDHVGMVKERGKQWMMVSTPGTKDFKHFWECGAGWVITEIKEAEIRITPQNASSSYVLDRHTHQIASMTSSKSNI